MAFTISGLTGLIFPDGTTQPSTATTTVGALRAWVNFNGTGTVAIRASGNVSSITDNGTGNYTVNFTNSMPDANYGFYVSRQYDGGQGGLPLSFKAENGTMTTSQFQIACNSGSSNAPADSVYVSCAIFR